MKTEGLSALLMLGNGAKGTNSHGCFRYLVDNKTFYYIQTAIFAPGREPVSLASTFISQYEFMSKSFVTNCRIAPDPVKGIIDVFRDMGIAAGKVGTLLDLFPSSWYLQIHEAFPEIEFVDITGLLYRMRRDHSAEEVDSLRRSAALADIAYKTFSDSIRPGVTERELVAELEFAVQKNGGETSYTQISSGKFGCNGSTMPYQHTISASDRVIEPGDAVAAQIAPCYNGYWTHLARIVTLGEPGRDLSELHSVVTGAVQDIQPSLRPGTPISAVAKRMKRFVENAGYLLDRPCGFICGLDPCEELLEEENTGLLIPGMAVVIAPNAAAPGQCGGSSWGETFLMTESGCEKLTKVGDALTEI